MAKPRRNSGRAARGTSRRSPTRRRAAKRPHRPSSLWRRLGVRVFLAFIVVAAGYAVWLDFTVRARFEGATWALPARIYARPLELYPGLSVTQPALVAELEAAGYHRVKHLRRSGSFVQKGSRFEIAARGFQFWDGEESPRQVSLNIAGDQVARLSEDGRAVGLSRLDPAQIGRVYPGHREDRELVRLDQVPKIVIDGLLALEDRKFYSHFGISPRGIARALWANVRAGATVQGGSTITQQLAKNLYLSSERRLRRKINEAFMALLLELRYDKDAILETYFNEVYLGQDGGRAIHGFGLASWFYFGRRLDELDIPESALLIGMVRGASLYNPRGKPQRAKRRRNLVLDVMAKHQVITAREAERAKAAPLGVTPRVPGGASPHPAFVDLVRSQLARDYRSADLRTEGLQIFTTLEPVAQQRAERALGDRLYALERRRAGAKDTSPEGSLEGAVVLVRPASGEVVALVGGREPRARGFNRAIKALRPIGSLAKPAVYLSALGGRRHHLMSSLIDAPVSIRTRGQPAWSPQNYDKKFGGKVPLVDALARSNNVATVRLGMDIGLSRIVKTLRALGIERPIPEVPAMLLGSVELSPLEVAQVYQTLANGGYRSPLRSIREVTDAQGRPLSRYGLQVTKAADPTAVYLVRYAMEKAMHEGTGRAVGRRLSPTFGFAGKTGTTDELRDSWFAGFNDALLGVVWVGRDDNRPAGLTGAGGALRVWGDVVPALAGAPNEPRAVPRGVSWQWINADGTSVTDADCPGALRMPFRVQSAPAYAPCPALSVISNPPRREEVLEIPPEDDAG